MLRSVGPVHTKNKTKIKIRFTTVGSRAELNTPNSKNLPDETGETVSFVLWKAWEKFGRYKVDGVDEAVVWGDVPLTGVMVVELNKSNQKKIGIESW